MKKSIALLYFIFLFFNAHCEKLDSLIKVYKSLKSDSERVHFLIKKLSKAYNNEDSVRLVYYKAIKIAHNAFNKTNSLSQKQYYYKSVVFALLKYGKLSKLSKKDKLHYYNIAFSLAENYVKMFPKDLEIYLYIGDYYNYKSDLLLDKNVDSAVYLLKLSALYYDKLSKFDSLNSDWINGSVAAYDFLGSIYLDKGDYKNSIYYYYKSLKIKERQLFYLSDIKNSDYKVLSTLYNNLANVYLSNNDLDEALSYYNKSLVLKQKINDSIGEHLVTGMIGSVYINKKQYDTAKTFLKKSISFFEKTKNYSLLAKFYNNLGVCYTHIDSPYQAIVYYKLALNINEKFGKKQSIAILNLNIANSYKKLALINEKQKNLYLKNSFEYLNKANDIVEKNNYLSLKDGIYSLYYDLYALIGNYKKAYEYSLLYQTIKDSLLNVEKAKAIADAKVQYETEKKQLVIDKLNKENELKQVKLEKSEEIRKRQRAVIIGIGTGLIVIIVSLIIISRMYVKIKHINKILNEQKIELENKNYLLNLANEEIRSQKEEIEHQRDIVVDQKAQIERAHKSLKESIEYASYIQKAVLRPIDIILEAHYPGKFNSFLLFKPRDIVSGDFYWSTFVNNYLIIAIADCTGHGVPGALMSMLGISSLNEIVRKKEVTTASMALELLRKDVIFVLHQKGSVAEQKDGMDISLVAINCETLEMQFAGANNHLLYLDSFKNEIIEIKGDKMPVAIYEKMSSYTNHYINLKVGDIIYLSTDGYKDQFGGVEGKKFLQKNFVQLLYKIKNYSIKDQEKIISETIYNWMNYNDVHYDQVDDITVFGLKVMM
jgi:serine phosphatase RsbU (regulator of sigma subunit)/tetratricopeptide (TPR) repeat protein